MRKPSRTRRPIVGAIAGLAFVLAAGIGLAEITPSSSFDLADASTTQAQTTVTQTSGREVESADDENEAEENESDDKSVRHEKKTTGATAAELTATTTAGNGQAKVEICHKTGSTKHPSHTITIAAPAVAAHIDHEDTMGACAESATTTSAVTTTQAGTSTQHQKKSKAQHSGARHGNSGQSHKPKKSSHGGGHGK